MASTADLSIVITGDVSGARKALQEFAGDTKKAQDSAGGLGKMLGDVGKIAAGFLTANVIQGGISKLSGFLNESIDAAKESAAVQAQLSAALTSTGGAAGVSLGELNKMSHALQDMTNFDDEAIGGAQALLLTFTSIGKDAFPDATKAVLDMSQALGQDLKSSSIQLGKALNDPTQGMTALRRVGVSFSEDQQKVIKTMQATGDLAGAQKMILKELNTEFGGSAAAAVKADGGITQLKNKMNDLQEEIGAKLIPVQVKLKQLQFEIVSYILANVVPAVEKLIETWGPKLQPIFDQVVAGWTTIGQALQTHRELLIGVVAVLGAVAVAMFAVPIAIAAVVVGIGLLVANWDKILAKFPQIQQGFDLIKQVAGAAADFIKDRWAALQAYWTGQLGPAFENIKTAIVAAVTYMRDLFAKHLPEMQAIVEAAVGVIKAQFELVKDVLGGVIKVVVDLINGDWAKAWTDLKDLAKTALEDFVALVRAQIDLAVAVFKGLGALIIDALGDLASLLYNQGKKAGESLSSGVLDALKSLPAQIADKLGVGGAVNIPGVGNINPLHRASGGDVYGGRPYLVGERGPELFVPNGSGSIVPNGAGGTTNVVHLHVAGSILSERDIVRIVRDALAGGGLYGVT